MVDGTKSCQNAPLCIALSPTYCVESTAGSKAALHEQTFNSPWFGNLNWINSWTEIENLLK